MTDEFGDPVANTPVEVRSTPEGSIQRFAQTDDRDEYRVGGLPAGMYTVVSRRTAPGVRPGYVDDETQSVTLEPGTVQRTDGRPIQHASVAVRAVSKTGSLGTIAQDAFTDANGRFEFSGLPAGAYRVQAVKGWYRRAATQPHTDVTLEDSADVNVIVPVPIADGAIEGDLTDEDGEPLENVSLQALEVRYEHGARRLSPLANSRLTDDLGHYRLFGLEPGRYVVAATAADEGGAELPGYARAFYPGTVNAPEAQFVSVGSGDSVSGISFTLRRERTARIAGRMIDSSGEPTTGGDVSLVPSVRAGAASMMPLGARIGDDGTFEFTNVPPGEYVVQAYRGRQTASTEGEFGSLPVVVADRDVTGLVLQTMAGSSIEGRIVFDSTRGRPQPSLAGVEIQPIPVDGDTSPVLVATADVARDGTFVIRGITGTRRIAALQVPSGWMLKEVRASGVDLTDRAIQFGRREQSLDDVEVVLTDRVSGVSGTVTGPDRTPVAGVPVIVFPADPDLRYDGSRYLRNALTSDHGTFAVSGLPAGAYYIAAAAPFRNNDPDGWQDPQALESLTAGAQSIVVRDGETTTVPLRRP